MFRQLYLTTLTLFVFVSSVYATNYREDSFEYYSTPGPDNTIWENGALYNLHVQEQKRILLINGEVITPIVYSDGDSFKLADDFDYDSLTIGWADSTNTWNGTTIPAQGVNVTSNVNIYLGDFNGDGYTDQLLQPKLITTAADRILFVVYGSNTDAPLGVEALADPLESFPIEYSDLTLNQLNPSAVTLNTDDVNNDGISDITVEYAVDLYTNSKAITHGNSQGLGNTIWAVAGGQLYYEIGVMKGQAAVSPSGAATYSVPIELPPALSGLQPSIALQYNSQARPIPFPQSISGIQPSAGFMGLGWHVSGISSISRCPTDFTRDDDIDGVDYDDNDQFCLDGQRLVLLTGTHGVADAEYRAQNNGFDKITVSTSDTNGPLSFKVWRKNGQISEYGTSLNSRQEAPNGNAIHRWNIASLTNKTGGEVEFIYEKDIENLKYRISNIGYEETDLIFSYDDNENLEKIEVKVDDTLTRYYSLTYTLNSNSTTYLLSNLNECDSEGVCLTPHTFNWQQGSEFISYDGSALGGFSNWIETELFGNINWLTAQRDSNGQLFTGDLNGDGRLDVGMLFHYYDSNGITKPENPKDEVSFVGWQSSGTNKWVDAQGSWSYTGGKGYWDQIANSSRKSRFISGDFNGDGRVGAVYIHQPSDSDATHVRIDHWEADSDGVLQFDGSISGGAYANWQEVLDNETYNGKTFSGDFNGDGKTDVALIYRDPTEDTVTINQWHSNANANDKDKLAHIERPSGSDGGTNANWDSVLDSDTHNGRTFSGDFNGDGKTDVALIYRNSSNSEVSIYQWHAGENGVLEYVENNNTGGAHANWDIALASASSYKGRTFEGDFNGDGKTDIALMYRNPADSTVSIYHWNADENGLLKFSGNGTSTSTHARWDEVLDNVTYNGRTFSGDFNGDGKTDVVLMYQDPDESTMSIYQWNANENGKLVFSGNGAGGEDIPWNVRASSYSRVFSGDFNGDGKSDIAFFSGNSNKDIFHWNTDVKQFAAIASIDNGLKIKTEFTYKALTDDSVYTPLNDGVYPNVETGLNRFVVSDYEITNDTDSLLKNTYQYEGMKVHKLGLGSMGFAKISKKDEFSKITETTEQLQDSLNWKIGIPAKETVTTDAGIILSETSYYWEVHTIDAAGTEEGFNKRYVRYLGRSNIKQNDLNGNALSESNVINCNVNYWLYNESDLCTANYHDEYGNNSHKKEVVTDRRLRGNNYLTTTTSDYWGKNHFSNDSTDWFVSLPKSTQVTQSGSYLTPLTHITEYDDYTADGQLKEITEVSGSNEITEAERANTAITTQYEYLDDYGRTTKETISGDSFTIRVTTFDYDEINPYLITQTQAANDAEDEDDVYHAQITELSPIFGSALSVSDVNQLSSSTTYDDFGRVTTQLEADGTISTQNYYWCAPIGTVTCVENGVFYLESTVKDGISEKKSITIFDNLERVISEQRQGFDGSWINLDTAYDFRGREVSVSEPYFQGDDIYSTTTTQFDLLNRPESKTLSNSATMSIARNGFVTTVTDARGHKSSAAKSAWGWVIKSSDDSQIGSPDSDGEIEGQTFTHDVWGNLLVSEQSTNNKVVMTYDGRGNKLTLNDPDKGYWQFEYNALGELLLQTDAKDQKTCLVYDLLGRLVKRIDNYAGSVSEARAGCTNDDGNPLISTWSYDVTTDTSKGIGQLHTVNGENDYSEVHSYDALGRPATKVTTIDGIPYTTGTTYYAKSSLPYELSYPTAGADTFKVRYEYNSLGYLKSTKDPVRNATLYSVAAMDMRDNVTEFTLGNGTKTITEYDPDTGFVDTIDTTSPSDTLQYLSYQFDEVGNLSFRKDLIHPVGLTEDFKYDNLNRVYEAKAFGGAGYHITRRFDYDENGLGNIRNKSDVGNYEYGLLADSSCDTQFEGPHAVTRTASGGLQRKADYCYDANGSMNRINFYDFNGTRGSDNYQAISYSPFDMVSEINSRYNGIVTFNYGPDRQLIQRGDSEGTATTNTTYVDGLYEHIVTGSNISHKYYVGNYAVVTKQGDVSPGLFVANYTHRDHLGSVDTISDENASVMERQSFDTWGLRRDPNWQTPFDFLNFDSLVTNRGYTDHEHIDSMGLIHMNGRVYNPVIGRFLSPDPVIQAPYNGQSYNRYSYVMNNSLSYTDPTGYVTQELFDWSSTWSSYFSYTPVNYVDVTPFDSYWANELYAPLGAAENALRFGVNVGLMGIEKGLNDYGEFATDITDLQTTLWSVALGRSERQAEGDLTAMSAVLLPAKALRVGKGLKNFSFDSGNPVAKYGPNAPPVRIEGDWSINDMKQGLLGHPPKGLGKPDLHHADQMPGAGVHEIIPQDHRGNKALHPNKFNQGVTKEMRDSDRKLHWWYRAREQGADKVLPDWIYDK